MRLKLRRLIGVVAAGMILSACNGVLDSSIPKHKRPVPEYLVKKMKTQGMTLGAPILLRIFKEENVLEVWKEDANKRFALLNTYEICKWSGNLGPKHKEGDKQAPEGFYHVTPGQMNPNSSYHLSFNMGFPNAYDRANDRTGSYLMIHGACSSAGCYSMTDEYAEELYALAREAFAGGQKAFQIQAFPFRMTAENMAKKVDHRDFEFWKMLKEGSDHFEITRRVPKVDVCEKRYVFNREAEEGENFKPRLQCPPAKMHKSLALAFNEKQEADQSVFDKVLKRNHASPFIKAEEKPRTLTASIKADATLGPLAIYDPAAEAAAKAAAEAAAKAEQEAKDAETTQPELSGDAAVPAITSGADAAGVILGNSPATDTVSGNTAAEGAGSEVSSGVSGSNSTDQAGELPSAPATVAVPQAAARTTLPPS